MLSVSEELNFKFNVVILNLNLNLSGHMWLVATIQMTRWEEEGAGPGHT